MNIQEYELMNILADERYKNQRELSEKTGYSLGKINSALKTLVETGYLDGQMGLTKKAGNEMEEKRPKNAVILADLECGWFRSMWKFRKEFWKSTVNL